MPNKYKSEMALEILQEEVRNLASLEGFRDSHIFLEGYLRGASEESLLRIYEEFERRKVC